ncbi:MAG: FAD-dependent oxidoreductase, partial [Candidatus Micrarchaeota archaeon]
MAGKRTAVVLGAGVTGLATAWKLADAGVDVTVLEKNPYLGGLSTTFVHGEYRLDLGPHKIYTQLDDVLAELQGLLGGDLLTIPKRSRIYMLGRYFDYPFKPVELMTGVNPLKAAGFGLSYAIAAARNKLRKPRDLTYEEYVVNRFGRKIYETVFKSYAEKV